MRRVLVPALLLVIACNKPPEGLVVSVGPDGAKTTDELDLDVVTAAVDPNKRDQVGLSVVWFKNDAEQYDLADLWRVPPSRTRKGQVWTAEVVATDSLLNSEPAHATIEIANSVPSVSLSVSSKAPKSDDDLVASFTVEDADGDTVDVALTWAVDGEDSGFTGATVAADRTGKGQVWTVTATPSDDEASGDAHSVDVTVRNTIPSVAAARTDPTTIREDTVASCVGAAWKDADPEDPETYEVTWTVNGVTVSSEPTLDGSAFDRGDAVVCVLTPVDNESAGDPVASAPVTVRNTGPMVLGAGMEPSNPTTTDDLEAVLTGFDDIDGDAAVAIYAWYVDGVETSTSSFLRSDAFEKGQEVYVRITGYDGLDHGTPRYGVATIANSPPSAPVVAVPEAPTDATDLICTVEAAAEDADGDPITYAMTWSVDGSVFTGGSFSTTWAGDTVPASFTTAGEAWSCTATPDDGEDAGSPATASATIDAS